MVRACWSSSSSEEMTPPRLIEQDIRRLFIIQLQRFAIYFYAVYLQVSLIAQFGDTTIDADATIANDDFILTTRTKTGAPPLASAAVLAQDSSPDRSGSLLFVRQRG